MNNFAETLRCHLEQSPFSEEFLFLRDSVTEPVWNIQNGSPRSVEFEYAFMNGAPQSTDKEMSYQFVPLAPHESGEEENVVVRGIFDESVERDRSKMTTRRKPRIYVYGWPRYTPSGSRVLVRGKVYKVSAHEIDANLGIVVWLN